MNFDLSFTEAPEVTDFRQSVERQISEARASLNAAFPESITRTTPGNRDGRIVTMEDVKAAIGTTADTYRAGFQLVVSRLERLSLADVDLASHALERWGSVIISAFNLINGALFKATGVWDSPAHMSVAKVQATLWEKHSENYWDVISTYEAHQQANDRKEVEAQARVWINAADGSGPSNRADFRIAFPNYGSTAAFDALWKEVKNRGKGRPPNST